MKTITTSLKLICLVLILVAAQPAFAQQLVENSGKKDIYRIKVVKDENGKKTNIDKTFASKAEMDAFVKDNHIEMPSDGEFKEKSCDKNKNKACEKTVKKITIIETEESNASGNTKLEISTSDLSPEERATLIQQIMNIKGSKVEVKQMHRNEVRVEKEEIIKGN